MGNSVSSAAACPGVAATTVSCADGSKNKTIVVLGAQWGDEGKGKLVDILAQRSKLVARFNGGSNAGHSLVVEGHKFAFHLLPCGMISKSCTNLIGNGVVLHIPTMLKEIASLKEWDPDCLSRLLISSRASLLFDVHQAVDGMLEQEKSQGGAKPIGTTRRGIGPCYANKIIRNGLRAGDLLHMESFEAKFRHLVDWLQRRYKVSVDIDAEVARYREYAALLEPNIVDSTALLADARKNGDAMLLEGANAALLDIDFGTYPFVTSSNTTSGGICTGLGLPPRALADAAVLGVVKAYTTRVGEGPFPTELPLGDETGDRLRAQGHEFGTTTGRPRRCGWLDVPVVRYAHVLNGFTSINVTKLDVLTGLEEVNIGVAYTLPGASQPLPPSYFPALLEELSEVQVIYETLPGWTEDISGCRSVADLPVNAQRYLRRLEALIEIPISWVGVGPGREEMFNMMSK